LAPQASVFSEAVTVWYSSGLLNIQAALNLPSSESHVSFPGAVGFERGSWSASEKSLPRTGVRRYTATNLSKPLGHSSKAT
jgi:hypothetical protein